MFLNTYNILHNGQQLFEYLNSITPKETLTLAVDEVATISSGKYGSLRLWTNSITTYATSVFSTTAITFLQDSSNISYTKDNADTLNIYYESGDLKMQNKLAISLSMTYYLETN